MTNLKINRGKDTRYLTTRLGVIECLRTIVKISKKGKLDRNVIRFLTHFDAFSCDEHKNIHIEIKVGDMSLGYTDTVILYVCNSSYEFYTVEQLVNLFDKPAE